MSELNSPQAALQMSAPTIEEVRDAAAAFSYGSPLIENGYRGLIAEILVAEALGAEWRICSGGWSGWDLEHVSGCRIEVKQSAARQTWAAPKKASAPSFGIFRENRLFRGRDQMDSAGGPASPHLRVRVPPDHRPECGSSRCKAVAVSCGCYKPTSRDEVDHFGQAQIDFRNSEMGRVANRGRADPRTVPRGHRTIRLLAVVKSVPPDDADHNHRQSKTGEQA